LSIPSPKENGPSLGLCLDAARETMVRVTLCLVVSELVRDKPQQKTVSLWTDGLEFLAQLERLSSS
jgi:hypothetical protein